MKAAPDSVFWADLPFRQNRAYVHSGSICNFWQELEPETERFELVLRQQMIHRLTFTPLEQGVVPADCGHVVLGKGERRRIWQIGEDSAHPVAERTPYDEHAIPRSVDEQDKTCKVEPKVGYTFFDRVVAGNKALINGILNPGVKLIAAKFQTPGFPADDVDLTLKLKSHVTTRIFKSSILVDGQPFGEVIYYGEQ